MKACVLKAPGRFCVEEVPVPVLKDGEALIRVAACGVCGSDISRIFGNGAHQFPLVPGHEFAGIVDRTGPGVDLKLAGKRVAVFPLIPCRRCAMCEIGEYAQCEEYSYLGSRQDGAFAEYVAAPAWNLVPVPESVSLEEAAMTEPAAVAIHALRVAGLDVGDTVMIFGAGPIGLILARWGEIWGARDRFLVDIDPARLQFAADLGFTNLLNAREADPVAWVRERTAGRGADLVVEGSGASAALGQAIEAARPLGRVVLMGNPAGEMRLSQQAYWALLRKQLRVNGTWNSSYSAMPRNEWELVLDHLAGRKLVLGDLITHRVSLDELPALIKRIRDRSVFSCKAMYSNREAIQ